MAQLNKRPPPPLQRELIDLANTAYNFSRWKEAYDLYTKLEKNIYDIIIDERRRNDSGSGSGNDNCNGVGDIGVDDDGAGSSVYGVSRVCLSEYPAGSGHVIYRLGFMHNRGHYFKKSTIMANRYFEVALKLLTKDVQQRGDPEALCDLAFMYNSGDGVPVNKKIALEYYMRAADQGYDRGQYNLGFMYSNGIAIPQDKAMAVKWYLLAAEQEHTWAQNNLGLLYDSGEGVECDKQMAVYWYTRSAEQQHSSAQNNLGLMYEKGEGVPKDNKMALKYYELAMNNGNASAQYNLARFYEKGECVKNDQKLAILYYFESAMKGQNEAQDFINEILHDQEKQNQEFFKNSVLSFLGQRWPEGHDLLHEKCQQTIIQLFLIFNSLGHPFSLAELKANIVKKLIMVYPEAHRGFMK